MVYSSEIMVYGIGLWFMDYGVWFEVMIRSHGLWRTVIPGPRLWFMDQELLSMVYGLWSMV